MFGILNAHDCMWQKRQRTFTAASLFAILYTKCGCISSAFEGLDMLQLLANPPPLASTGTPSGVSRALQRLPQETFASVARDLVHEASCSPLLQRLHPAGHPLCFAVDGCHMWVPPKLAKHGYGGKQATMLLTAVVEVMTDVIVGYDISPSLDERAGLCRLIHKGTIPANSVVLADRGYFSEEVWGCLHHHGIKAVLRVPQNACNAVTHALTHPCRWKSMDVFGTSSQLTVWSAHKDARRLPCAPTYHPSWCTAVEQGQRGAPLAYQPDKDDWILLSNVVLSAEAAAALYCLRWRVETVFRTLKSGMGAGHGRGSAVANIHAASAACLAYIACRLLEIKRTWHKRIARAHTGKPLGAWVTSCTRHRPTMLRGMASRLATGKHTPLPGQARHRGRGCPETPRHEPGQHTVASMLHMLITGDNPLLYGLYAHALLAHAVTVRGALPLSYFFRVRRAVVPTCLS